MHGCYQHLKKASGDKVGNVDGDAEQGIYDVPTTPQSSNPSNNDKGLEAPQEHLVRQPAGTWGYIFQIIFQVNLAYITGLDKWWTQRLVNLYLVAIH